MRAHLFFLCALMALSISFFVSPVRAEEGTLTWKQLSDLPDLPSGTAQVGLGGHFGGVHNGVVILAGGANFPDGAPWKNGVKIFWNDIYVLEMDESGKSKWVPEIKTKLPKPIAYGVSVSTESGIICIGGADGTQCFSDVVRLKWNSETRDVEIEELPPLPTTLAHMTATQVGDVIYVAGGITAPFTEGTKSFFALDLNPKPETPVSLPEETEAPADVTPPTTPPPTGTPPLEASEDAPKGTEPTDTETDTETPPSEAVPEASKSSENGTGTPDDPKGSSEPPPVKPEVIGEETLESPTEPKPIPLAWKELTPWDGGSRAFAASAAQSDGEKACFFLFSGRNPQPDGTSVQLVDSHKYDPSSDQWVKFPDIALPDTNPRSVVAASAIANGENSILIFGGDDGTMAKVSALLVSASNSTSRDAYLKLNETILENHPGFSRDILSLDTVNGVWSNIATFPESCPVTAPIFRWNSKIVIPSGEISPGIRSLKLWIGTWKPKK